MNKVQSEVEMLHFKMGDKNSFLITLDNMSPPATNSATYTGGCLQTNVIKSKFIHVGIATFIFISVLLRFPTLIEKKKCFFFPTTSMRS